MGLRVLMDLGVMMGLTADGQEKLLEDIFGVNGVFIYLFILNV